MGCQVCKDGTMQDHDPNTLYKYKNIEKLAGLDANGNPDFSKIVVDKLDLTQVVKEGGPKNEEED